MAKKKNPCKFILLKTGEELNYDQARDFLFKNYDFNTKTLKSESYAVQVEEPGQVPVQPEAGISREMAEGAPQAKPEVTAEKGKVEEKVAAPLRDVESTAKALEKVSVFDQQDQKAEIIVGKEKDRWGRSQVWRERIENAGDILRELTSRGKNPDVKYLQEKIEKIKDWLLKGTGFESLPKNVNTIEDIERSNIKFSTVVDGKDYLEKFHKDVLDETINAYKNIVVKTEQEQVVKDFILSLLQNNKSDIYSKLRDVEDIIYDINKKGELISTPLNVSEAYHADKAAGKETELTKAVEELLTPTEYEIKKEDVQPMLEGVRGVRPEEKGREVSPGVRAEEEAKREEEVRPLEQRIAEEQERLEKILFGDVDTSKKKKSLASKVRQAKIDTKGKAFDATLGLPVAVYNSAVEIVAKAIEGGSTVAKAIQRAVKFIDSQMKGKDWNRGVFYKNMNVRYQVTLPQGGSAVVEVDNSKKTAEVIDGWYSPLEQTLLDTKQERLPAKQWLDRFAKTEEAKWTGLQDWLSNQDGTVSKQDILDYLKDNRVQVVTVVKGEEQKYTKFSQYQLEGEKSNYKEVLVTLPREKITDLPEGFKIKKTKRGYEGEFPDGSFTEEKATEQEVRDWAIKWYNSNYREAKEATSKFRSSHFDEPNILVHLRMNTRTDADGKKVLFVEEIQSDWGQKGKKEGFDDINRSKLVEKQEQLTKDIWERFKFKNPDESTYLTRNEIVSAKKPDGSFMIEDYTKTDSVLSNLWDEFQNNKNQIGNIKRIAPAPFVMDTNSWVKLGLKTALKEAVDQKVDKIAWTTGEQQNERYDLSKQVEFIDYSKNSDGTYNIGSDVQGTSYNDVDLKQIENIFGKDIAEKVQQGVGIKSPINSIQTRLDGLNLKVGGKGMKGFYGSMEEGTKGIVGGVAESLFGQKVGETKINKGTDDLTKNEALDLLKQGEKIYTYNRGNIFRLYDEKDINEATNYFSKKGEAKSTQPSIDITPQLIESVEKGLPLFEGALSINDRIKQEKQKLSDLFNQTTRMGFAFDPKKQAEVQYNIHKTLVNLAKLYIEKGINTVADFANSIKLRVQDVERAWEEAFSGKELSESKLRKELENNPYDVQAISQALMTPEQAAAKSPLQIEADDAVKNNQVYSFEDFDAMMKANPNYKSLSSADKKNLYDNAVMEFNTNVVITLEQETPTIFNPEGWFTKFIRKWFDPKIRLKNVQEQLKQNDIEVLKEANAYLAYELLNGQSASKIEDFENEIIKSKSKAEPSLIERMIKDKADPDMVGLFMYAQHAKERNDAVAAERQELYTKKVDELNAQISAESDSVKKQRLKDKLAKIVEGKDPDYKLMPDGGSGMTNKQAEEILQSFEQAGTYDLYEKYANEWREKVTKRALQMRLDYGLISEDTFKDLTTKFQYYVPLNVVEKTKGKSATKTPGHGVRGRDIFRAKGSNLYSFTERYNPIVSSSFHFKNVIIRGEENKAAQALLELAKLDKNNELFEIIKPRTRIVYDSNGEEIVIPIDQIPSDAFALKDKGKQVYIRLKDPGLRDEINKQGVMRGIRGLFIINNWIRNTSLLLNPEFMLSNSIKDFQTALVNIQSVKKDLDVKGITRDLLNPKNIKGAMKGVYADINGDYKSDWAKWAKEYRDAGGKVSWFAPETMDESLVSLNKQIEKLQKGENVFEKAFNLYVGSFFKMQSSVEQYIRLSAYKALRDKGVSKEEAASAAKNLTVNFERRGTVMGLVDSLYLFTGAKLGAIYRLTASMKKSKASRAILGSLVAYGFLESLMNYYLGGDDEEDRKIEEGMKERSLIFLNPTDPANKLPYRFPIQYGLNVFKYAGNVAFDVSVGRKSVFEGSKLLMTSVWNNVLPFEGPTAGQAFAPTAFDPIVQAYENKNFFGGDIVPKQPLRKEARKKESELYFKTARPLSVKIAKKIDEITGGTELTEGQISISPEILDHTYDSFTGGVGRFAANLVETGIGVGSKVLGDKDAEMSAEKIPFVRLFVGGKKDENFQNVFDIVSESSVKKIDDKDLKYFNSNLNDLLKRGSIDKDQYKNYKENVEKNQFKINEESTLVNYLKKFENYLSENGYEPLDNKTKAKVINEIGTYMYNNYKMGNDIKQINLLPALSRNTEYVKKKK